MKQLPLKTKIIFTAAAVILLIWAYFAGETRPDRIPSEERTTLCETETTTEAPIYETALRETTVSETVVSETTVYETTVSETKISETTLYETTSETTTQKGSAAAVQTAAPQAEQPQEAELSCTISINCANIYQNIDKFDDAKIQLLPENGFILAPTEVKFSEGETVFDVLKRVTRENGIHFEFAEVPAYNSVYIEGINNIYEFDCGELSGWMYKVNGETPGTGSSLYKLKNKDKIEWLYTCDLGRDIGDSYYDK